MSDQDFDFAPPPPRRERKQFEPPPWEQHLFDRSTKEQEQELAETETAEADKPMLDEVELAAMMFELRAEEVPASRMYARATLAAGTTLLLVGLVMVIWAFVMIAVALRRPEQGRAGVYVGMTVLMFGAGFAGAGAWFVFKTLRQQGVL